MTRPGRKRSRPLLSASDFEAVAALLPPLTVRQREAARLVMVEGISMAEAGGRVGFTRQNVSLTVKRLDSLLDALTHAKGHQGGWNTVTLAGPAELLAKWKAEAVVAAETAKALNTPGLPRGKKKS